MLKHGIQELKGALCRYCCISFPRTLFILYRVTLGNLEKLERKDQTGRRYCFTIKTFLVKFIRCSGPSSFWLEIEINYLIVQPIAKANRSYLSLRPFSRAWHQLRRFPAPGTSSIFSLAWHQIHASCATLLTCFPTLGIRFISSLRSDSWLGLLCFVDVITLS